MVKNDQSDNDNDFFKWALSRRKLKFCNHCDALLQLTSTFVSEHDYVN